MPATVLIADDDAVQRRLVENLDAFGDERRVELFENVELLFRVREGSNDLVREEISLVSALIDQVRDHRLCHHLQTTRGLDKMRRDLGVARAANKCPPLNSGGLKILISRVDGDQCGLASSAHSACSGG